MIPRLPVSEVLPDLAAALRTARCAVVQAEPGAGKTMLVPELVSRVAPPGRTILVEPRRIAARAAAAGLCAVHGLRLGRECGFAVRGEQALSRETKILAVTPGVLLRMLQEDVELSGVAALIFDEFHERSLEADLSFALALEVRSALREDLLLTVMSATLDAARVGEFLAAPVIRAAGRSFPVEILRRPGSPDVRDAPRECARAVLEQFPAGDGDMLVFLPGAEEIERGFRRLAPALPPDALLLRLHGALPFAEQRRALAPAPPGMRKIILSTNVAESSITVDGVRTVIDSGWEKVPVYRPGAGMTFLEPRRITLDSAVQRAGRAGRTAPGRAVRCYDAPVEAAMREHADPEILHAELFGPALTLAVWGGGAERLRWLDPPPEAALRAARAGLRELGLLDGNLRPTSAGRRAAAVPVHPRLAAMLIRAPESLRRTAAALAALLEERSDVSDAGADLREKLEIWRTRPERFAAARRVFARLTGEFPGPAEIVPEAAGRLLATAFPEWLGGARVRHGREFQLAGGRAALLRDGDPLLGAEFLAVARLDAPGGRDAVIRLAAPLSAAEIEALFPERIVTETVTAFDPETERFTAREERKFRALVLASRNCPVPEAGVVPALIREALRRRIPLPPPEAASACRLVERVRFGRAHGMEHLPDWSPEALASGLPEAASGFLSGVRTFAALKKAPWREIFRSMLDPAALRELDRLCPKDFTAPTGMKFPIDYSGDVPALAIPVQQLYGVKVHPRVGASGVPLKLELLSPARRPVQITSDLPGFWQGNWHRVVREMRARYPKHEWADDPAEAAPMRRSVRSAKAPR